MVKENENNREELQEEKKFSDFFYNRISYAGIFLALFIFLVECFLFGVDFFTEGHNVYLGVITYTVLPPFLILGLILIPLGALRRRRRVLKGLVARKPKTLFIDPAIPQHRNAIFVFLVVTMVFIIMTGIGSYKAFHYTESVHFCGITCHQVMKPQYTAYLNSPHARVKCVECHIGEGADWYVRSKLSGLRQVYHTVKGDYSKPIPTPIENLRPAKETCERCHWPNKFYRSFEMNRRYYLTSEDAEHPQWQLRMLIQVGGTEGENHGIHAHMDINNDIYYYAEDEKLQKITWVKSVDKEGNETVYKSDDYDLETEMPPEDKIHKMDCMDCHNRPTHQIEAPFRLLNQAMYQGQVNPSIPLIKVKALELMTEEYETTEEGVSAIREGLGSFYKTKYPDYYAHNKESIKDAIETIIYMYRNNFFPEMKVRWDIYQENIGHMFSKGCFRCHDDQHTSEEGKVITRDCKVCHTIIEQGPPGALEKSTDGLDFRHPVDIFEMWKDSSCSDCHTGGGASL